MDNNQATEALFHRYLNNECSAEEIKMLLQLFDEDETGALLNSLIRQQIEQNDANTSHSKTALLKANFKAIKNTIRSNEKRILAVPMYARRWFKLSAAAAGIFLLSATAYFLFPKKETTSIAQSKLPITPGDIQPGQNKAILTLDNGEIIILDSANNGTLAYQGNSRVLKTNGQIIYNNTHSNETKIVYNTIATANGNQYELILSDGSKVWLNAASSIRFPTSFNGNKRNVEITGEAYFEVTKNTAKPFIVNFKNNTGGTAEIEVLGTRFNVNTYTNEPKIKTTLLEGSVQITSANAKKILSPAEQATLTPDGIEIKKNVDTDQVTAWKNGYFLFDNTDVYSVMRQVCRWYNIDVEYTGKPIEEGFSGRILRDVPLSEFAKMLELNDIHARIEGRKMIIEAKNN